MCRELWSVDGKIIKWINSELIDENTFPNHPFGYFLQSDEHLDKFWIGKPATSIFEAKRHLPPVPTIGIQECTHPK